MDEFIKLTGRHVQTVPDPYVYRPVNVNSKHTSHTHTLSLSHTHTLDEL